MKIRVREEVFELLAQKCLFWPAQALLAVADLHLGKSETFQARGLWLPSQAHRDDLDALTALCRATGAKRVVFLGDLVHSAIGTTSEIRALFAEWHVQLHKESGATVEVLLGNHDRALAREWPQEWSAIAHAERLELGGFVFQHEPPPENAPEFHWVGHVHPVVRLVSGADRLRLPCFVVDQNMGLLPAFSSVAGGFELGPARGRRIFAIAGSQVFELPGPARKNFQPVQE